MLATLHCCGCGRYDLDSVSESNQATPEPSLPGAVLFMRSHICIYLPNVSFINVAACPYFILGVVLGRIGTGINICSERVVESLIS